jgi:TPR repeat protein
MEGPDMTPLKRGAAAIVLLCVTLVVVRGCVALRETAAERQEAALRTAKENQRRHEEEQERARLARRKIDVGALYDTLRKNAEAGDPDAQFLMGVILTKGMEDLVSGDAGAMMFSVHFPALIGEPMPDLQTVNIVNIPAVPADPPASVRWYERAARQGHAEAQVWLADDLADKGRRLEGLTWILISERLRRTTEKTPAWDYTDTLRLNLRGIFQRQLSDKDEAEARRRADAFRPVPERPAR